MFRIEKHPTRRGFIKTGVGVASVLGGLSIAPKQLRALDVNALGAVPPIRDPDVKAYVQRTINAARDAGATYADARLTRTHWRGYGPGTIECHEVLHVGVRSRIDGCWGFASSSAWNDAEMVRLGIESVRQAKANRLASPKEMEWTGTPPVTNGHWETAVKRDLLNYVNPLEIRDALQGLRLWTKARFGCEDSGVQTFCVGRVQEQAFGSTENTYYTQRKHEFEGFYQFFGAKGIGFVDAMSLAGGGWELFADQPLRELAEREAERNKQLLELPVRDFDVGKFNVLAEAPTVAVLLSKTMGCATELDRMMGSEANGSGTSYLNEPNEMLGAFKIGPASLNITSNRDEPGGMATTGWDDEGVKPEPFVLVKDGIVSDFHTSRESVQWISSAYTRERRPMQSHGNMSSLNAWYPPLIQPGNLQMESGRENLSVLDLERVMEKGIVFDGGIKIDADFQLASGMLACDSQKGGRAYEVRNGKRVARLGGEAAMLYKTSELWKSIIAQGGDGTRKRIGFGSNIQNINDEFKGDPQQVIKHSVTALPVVFKDASVIRGGSR